MGVLLSNTGKLGTPGGGRNECQVDFEPSFCLATLVPLASINLTLRESV
jgi:hypothetical protein